MKNCRTCFVGFGNVFQQRRKTFIHPIIKGIIIHFMLAYFHPFVDGNERTARSLFYWYMLKKGVLAGGIYVYFTKPYTRPKGTMKKPTSIQNMTTTIRLISSYTIYRTMKKALKN